MTDEYHGHVTKIDGTRVPLSKDEAKEIWDDAEKKADDRAKRMPTSDDAMSAIFDAQQRMKALGWRMGLGLTVKRGDKCAVRENGSTGIWSGRVDGGGKYVHYADSVSEPRRVWIKPISELTAQETQKMKECDKDARQFSDRFIQCFTTQEEGRDDG